ncbi:MAG: minor capsid protein [Magnetococcales bacterium]|nr:minor capsid protein [Magnetococcales bacterium]
MAEIDLSYALRLPPKEAIAFLQQKGFAITWDWKENLGERNVQSFSVSRATKLEVLQAIHAELLRVLTDGITERTFIKELAPALEKLGWWGWQELTDPKTGETRLVNIGPWRLQTIFRTNIQAAYMAGRYKAQIDGAEDRPWWEYVAVLDERTRPGHAALHGRIFRYDDPIWDFIYPPNGFNCRCRVRTLSDFALERSGGRPENSAGRIGEIVVPIGEDREGNTITRTVKTFRYTDAMGQEKIFHPDPGFDYNPGRTWARWDALGSLEDCLEQTK